MSTDRVLTRGEKREDRKKKARAKKNLASNRKSLRIIEEQIQKKGNS